MQLFELRPDDDEWGRSYQYEINAHHMWGLPGLRCEECGATWAMSGISYPSINLATLVDDLTPYLDRKPVSRNRLIELVQPLRPAIPEPLPLLPGTDLGPLVGKAEGVFAEFAWLNPWTPLAAEHTIDAMAAAGIDLTALRPRLEPNGARLLELEILAVARLAPASFDQESLPCEGCGRVGGRIERVVVARGSVPSQHHLFRPANAPTIVLASQRFVDLVAAHNFQDIVAAPVEVQ